MDMVGALDIDAGAFDEVQRLQRLVELKKTNGLFFYSPHEKQDAFHRAGEFKRRLARTGNRFGKSTMGAAEDCSWARGERPWYKKDDPARYMGIPQRSTKGLIIVADWDKAHEIFTNPVEGQGQGKLFKLLPGDSITFKGKNNAGVISELRVKSIWGGESIIMLDTVQSFKSNPMGQESSDWDWIHVDEPCPKDMWIANSRGLVDRFGSAWFTCTPIDEPWINDEFVPKNELRIMRDGVVTKDRYHWMLTGTSFDNPHNSEESLNLFMDGLSQEQKDCRIKGIPLAMSGLIYKDFQPDKHVYHGVPFGWTDMDRPPMNYTIRYAVDPHPQTPHAVLFAATSPEGQVYFFAEIFDKLTAEGLAERINEYTLGYYVHTALCDPAGFIESPVDRSVFGDELIARGCFVEKAPKDLSRGIISVQQELTREFKSPAGATCKKLMFGAHLLETLYEFDHYRWDSKRPNKPVDKEDHMMENLYRLVITGLDYVDPGDNADSYISNTVPYRSNFRTL